MTSGTRHSGTRQSVQAAHHKAHIKPYGSKPSGMLSPSSDNPHTISAGISYDGLPLPPLQKLLCRITQAYSARTADLAACIEDFWQTPVTVKFLSASTDSHYFWRLDDFFVAQATLDESLQKTLQLRSADTLCATLLNQVLGTKPQHLDDIHQTHAPAINTNATTRPQPFHFNQLTPFETHLLNEFSKDLLAHFFRHGLYRKPQSNKRMPVVHLVWSIHVHPPTNALFSLEHQPDSSEHSGKLVLSVPLDLIKLPKESDRQPSPPLSDHAFFHCHAPAILYVGSARLPLDELQGLESGDILVLDHSQSDQLGIMPADLDDATPASNRYQALFFTAVLSNREAMEIPVSPQELARQSNNQQEYNAMSHSPTSATTPTTRGALWNSLMIDVQAEFFPLRLPLAQLKQMSEGLIVELGDLSSNEIRLHAEGKTLAIGELVIVGDKFGIRIDRIQAERDESELLPSSNEIPTVNAPAGALPAASSAIASSHSMDDDFGADDTDGFDDDFGDDNNEYDAPQASAPAPAASSGDDDFDDDDLFGDDDDDWDS